MKKSREEYERIKKSLDNGLYTESEAMVISSIIEDAYSVKDLNIVWESPRSPMDCGWDLRGRDLDTLATIYIEIKVSNHLDRSLVLSAVNAFRKQRTEGRDNDIYLLAFFDKEKATLKYYDLSAMVKSSESVVGDFITESIANAQETIAPFLIKNKGTKGRYESIGDKQIPNKRKENKSGTILRMVMYFIALIFILAFIAFDWLGWYKVSMARLVLIGMFVVVCLLLFIREIRLGDAFSLVMVEAKDNSTNSSTKTQK